MQGLPSRIAVGLGLLPFLAGCGSNEAPTENAGAEELSGVTLTVAALQIQSGPGAAGTPASRTLTGNFEIRPPHPGEQSVANATVGGACMIAQVPTTPKACAAQEECNIAAGPGKPALFGYCNSGTCWVKADGDAGEKYCNRGVGQGAHQIPAFYPEEVYAHVPPVGPGGAAPVKWMVFACLNGPSVEGKPRPCGGGPGEKMFSEGNTRTVP